MVVEPGRSARADRLYWDAVSDRLWMWGAPAAEVADAKTRLRARRIVFDNRLGLVTLTDSVDLEGEGGGGVAPAGIFNLSPRGGPDGTHWRLRCRRLEATMKDQDISGLHAAGDVEIRTEDTVTTSETLSYDHDIARLTGHPVRIESGRDFVEARAVTMDAKRKTALLTGVKRMTMHVKGGMQGLVGLTPAQPEAASAETPVTLTCRGPVWVDQTRGAFVARDGVVVTTPQEGPADNPGDSRLETDRLFLSFNPETRELTEARATGRVWLRTPTTAAAGDRLVYDVPTATASFSGLGKALISREGSVMRVDEILVSDGGKTIRFLARHSKGSISFPDRGRPGERPDDWMKNPLRDLTPKKDKK